MVARLAWESQILASWFVPFLNADPAESKHDCQLLIDAGLDDGPAARAADMLVCLETNFHPRRGG
jgi:hypothetical protein